MKGLSSGQLADEEETRRAIVFALDRSNPPAEEEIRQAAREVDSQLRQAALAKQKWDLWQQHVRGLQEKRGVGQATEFEVSEAPALPAGGKQRRRIADRLEIRQAKLAQAQGLLACQCGYRLPGR